MTAVRLMKQEWPSKVYYCGCPCMCVYQVMYVYILQCDFYTQAGSSIRQAILKEQEGYPSPPVCLVYDVSIRNVFDYEQSSNQIKVQ